MHIYIYTYIYIYILYTYINIYSGNHALSGENGAERERGLKCSRASVLETLLTAQTRLVLQTAIHRRQKRVTQTDTKTSTPCNGVHTFEFS